MAERNCFRPFRCLQWRGIQERRVIDDHGMTLKDWMLYEICLFGHYRLSLFTFVSSSSQLDSAFEKSFLGATSEEILSTDEKVFSVVWHLVHSGSGNGALAS